MAVDALEEATAQQHEAGVFVLCSKLHSAHQPKCNLMSKKIKTYSHHRMMTMAATPHNIQRYISIPFISIVIFLTLGRVFSLEQKLIWFNVLKKTGE